MRTFPFRAAGSPENRPAESAKHPSRRLRRKMNRQLLLAALRRPWIVPAMISAAWAFRSRGWHRRPPFIPLPSKDYLRWRMETAYGDPGAKPSVADIADFLRWSARMRRRMTGRSAAGSWAKVGGVLGLAAFAVWANAYGPEQERVREIVAGGGYAGLLGASVLSGFNVIAAVPVVWFFPLLMEAGLEPVPTLATIALGMTGGDLLGYVVGTASRDVFKARMIGFHWRVERLRARHPVLPLILVFAYAGFVPAPNELVVVPLAYFRYPALGIMTAVFSGNIVFNTWMAFGVGQLFGADG